MIIKAKRIFLIILACVMVFSFSCSVVYASAQDEVGDAYAALNGEGDDDTVEGTLRKIANVLVGVAMAISIFKLAQIGFQFMLGAGSKKSNAKASLIPWVVGVFICALWLSIGNWIMDGLAGSGIAPDGPFDLSF